MSDVLVFTVPGGNHVFVENRGPAGPAGPAGPVGSVTGPVSSVVDRVATFADTSGDVLKDSGVSINDLALASAVSSALTGKEDKVTGKGLSENDFTDADKAKLDAVSLGTFRGTFDDETALTAALPVGDANEGDYAYVVDPVPGEEQVLYIWDVVNEVWTKVAPGSTPSNATEILDALETDPGIDYNTLTDSRLTQLNGTVQETTFNSVIETLTGGAAPTTNVVNDNTTSRTLSPTDSGKLIILQNASPCTITVENDATSLWTLFPPISFYVSNGIPVVTAGAGVTIVDAAGILSALAPGDTFTLKKIGADLWITVVGM